MFPMLASDLLFYLQFILQNLHNHHNLLLSTLLTFISIMGGSAEKKLFCTANLKRGENKITNKKFKFFNIYINKNKTYIYRFWI